jgi:hypothetical protein
MYICVRVIDSGTVPTVWYSFSSILSMKTILLSLIVFVCARHVYGVTFIKYTQYRNIGKLNNFKVFLSNTGKTIKLSKIVFIDKMEEKKYHTVRTIPESITLTINQSYYKSVYFKAL